MRMRKYLHFFLSVCFMFVLSILFVSCGKQAETSVLTEDAFCLDYTISSTEIMPGEIIGGKISFSYKNYKSYNEKYIYLSNISLRYCFHNDKFSIPYYDEGKKEWYMSHYDSATDTISYYSDFQLETSKMDFGDYYFYAYATIEVSNGQKFELKTDEIKITIKYEKTSEGLEYELDNDGTYTVVGIGECEDTNLVIPSVYNYRVVDKIADGAFRDCNNLKTVRLFETMTWIGYNAFDRCENLTAVTMPKSVSRIDNYAFEGCISLADIVMPTDASIGADIFLNTGIYNSANNWENNLLYVGDYLVSQKIIGEMAITIKDGTKVIADCIFLDCDIVSVKIPSSVTHIGDRAFMRCRNLKNIEVEKNNQRYYSIDGNLYRDYMGAGLVQYANGKKEIKFTLPEGVDFIDGYAFAYNTNLRHITIPEGAFGITYGAFDFCKNLETLELPQSLQSFRKSTNCDNLAIIYYKGELFEWQTLLAYSHNTEISENATCYFYSETEPIEAGDWWHYIDGDPTIWKDAKAGDVYTLIEAYYADSITFQDLLNIAYHSGNESYNVEQLKEFEPIDIGEKDENIEIALKQQFVEEYNIDVDNEECKADIDDIDITYYGCYNGFYVFMYKNDLIDGPAEVLADWEIVEGVRFRYTDSRRILLWKIESLS